MPVFAFWNIDKNVPPERISAFVREWDVDILVLAENQTSPSELRRTLNTKAERLYFQDIGESTRLTILTRFRVDRTTLVRDSHGVAIRHYQMPLGASILLVAAHLSSKLWKKTEEQILASTRVARYVRDAEERVGHSRTIIIGDLNMNPFEIGVIGSEGLHAVMDRKIAARGSRTVHGEERAFFYNPMWAQFGDVDSTPPGTYFYDAGGEVNFYWNVFDQVLLRPALLDFATPNSVNVVTELQGVSLLTDVGHPNRKDMSDHLPIVCRLDEILEDANVE